MSLFITSLNSGSNGNCYYVGNENEAVLVDVGITCLEIEKRLANLRLPMQRVKAIFISHEHIDHIRGVVVLARKYKLPVYSTPDTIKHTGLRPGKDFLNSLKAKEPVVVGGLVVTPFMKPHDAIDPVSFIIEHNGIIAGVMTDIGNVNKSVIHYFKQCHACFLESNYDDKMLEEGTYPIRLKNRIRGGNGHLSNLQALELFMNHRPAFMSHLFLSHLSKNNNHPDLVFDLFSKYAVNTNIIIASRDEETAVYEIGKTAGDEFEIAQRAARKECVQLRMFS